MTLDRPHRIAVRALHRSRSLLRRPSALAAGTTGAPDAGTTRAPDAGSTGAADAGSATTGPAPGTEADTPAVRAPNAASAPDASAGPVVDASAGPALDAARHASNAAVGRAPSPFVGRSPNPPTGHAANHAERDTARPTHRTGTTSGAGPSGRLAVAPNASRLGAVATSGPEDWGRPLYERVLDAVGGGPGRFLLDVGCGSGQLCRMAADRGMLVTGVDSDPIQLNRAAARVPEAILRRADLHDLPFSGGHAAAVSCVQVLMHLSNPLAALRELARVAAPGAPIVLTVWGPPELCAVGAFGSALTPLLGAPPWTGPRRPGPPSISDEGRLAKLASLAGLTVRLAEDVVAEFDHPDERALLAGLYASEIGKRAVGLAGRPAVRRMVLAGLTDHRRPDGGYRLANTFRLVVATG
jgi:SAM-dependent methyltransferase